MFKNKKKSSRPSLEEPMTENLNLTTEILQIEELEAKIAPDSGSVPITLD